MLHANRNCHCTPSLCWTVLSVPSAFMAEWVPADCDVAASGSAVPICSLGAVAPPSAMRVLHMRELYLQHQSGV